MVYRYGNEFIMIEKCSDLESLFPLLLILSSGNRYQLITLPQGDKHFSDL